MPGTTPVSLRASDRMTLSLKSPSPGSSGLRDGALILPFWVPDPKAPYFTGEEFAGFVEVKIAALVFHPYIIVLRPFRRVRPLFALLEITDFASRSAVIPNEKLLTRCDHRQIVDISLNAADFTAFSTKSGYCKGTRLCNFVATISGRMHSTRPRTPTVSLAFIPETPTGPVIRHVHWDTLRALEDSQMTAGKRRRLERENLLARDPAHREQRESSGELGSSHGSVTART